MNKEELFKKYNIDKSHSQWQDHIDNWFSVELFRVMNKGELPDYTNGGDKTKYIIDFLDKCKVEHGDMLRLKDFGSLYLTAKRMVYRHSEQILKEINQ